MSHFNTLPSKLTDAEILKSSLRELGITVKADAEVRGVGCQKVKAEVVAVLAGGYDLGWSRSADGTLSLIADLWAVSRENDLSRLMTQINQKYAVNQTLAQLQRPELQNAKVKLTVNC
jgi:Protein of unknown function (DUF1257)